MRRISPLAALMVIPIFLVAVVVAQTPVSKTIPVQGRLADSGGSPLSGTYSVLFSIYDVESGGTALWSSGTQSITVTLGYFSANLGPITLSFDRAYWLEVKIGTEILQPRQRLAPAPYAMNVVPEASINVSSLVVASQVSFLNVSQLFATSLSVINDITNLKIASLTVTSIVNKIAQLAVGTLTADNVITGNLTSINATITTLNVTGALYAPSQAPVGPTRYLQVDANPTSAQSVTRGVYTLLVTTTTYTKVNMTILKQLCADGCEFMLSAVNGAYLVAPSSLNGILYYNDTTKVWSLLGSGGPYTDGDNVVQSVSVPLVYIDGNGHGWGANYCTFSDGDTSSAAGDTMEGFGISATRPSVLILRD